MKIAKNYTHLMTPETTGNTPPSKKEALIVHSPKHI